jgi:hypothetical protein
VSVSSWRVRSGIDQHERCGSQIDGCVMRLRLCKRYHQTHRGTKRMKHVVRSQKRNINTPHASTTTQQHPGRCPHTLSTVRNTVRARILTSHTQASLTSSPTSLQCKTYCTTQMPKTPCATRCAACHRSIGGRSHVLVTTAPSMNSSAAPPIR